MAPELPRTLLLALLACGGEGRPPEGAGARTWTGWERYRQGTGATAEDLDCDLRWTVSGTEASQLCPSCTFTFSVVRTLDEEASSGVDACLFDDATERVYALVEDWSGNGPYLGTVEGGAFAPLAPAEWSEEDGRLRYRLGNPGYDAGSYYMVDYFEGAARIAEAAGDTGGSGAR